MLSALPRGYADAQQVVAADKLSSSDAWAHTILARPVTITLDRVTLERAVNAVAAAATVRIGYQVQLLDAVTIPVSIHAMRTPLSEVLTELLRGTGLQAVPVARGQLSIEPVPIGRIAGGVITGTVIDVRTKTPLADAVVTLDGMTRGVPTTNSGSFRIAGVTTGIHTVSVRRIGYKRVTQTVTVGEDGPVTMAIALEPSVNALDQVVVTGTVAPTELKAVPNAITVITAEQIGVRGITRIDQLFRGDVPGLFVQNQGSNASLDEVTMYSRGATTLSTFDPVTSVNTFYTNPIKTYVDGVELADPKYLSQIDPASIERIEILTGPQASTIYGSNAINGVMQIFTKHGTSNTPQLTLSLLSGWVENNFSSARTPQHDYGVQLNGVEGRLIYNAGGSWNYMGPWTPAKQTSRTGGLGSARLDLSTSGGQVTTDVTLRRTLTQNLQRGTPQQRVTGYQVIGWWRAAGSAGLSNPATYTLTGQTLGLTLGYVPTRWWSHDLEMGQDASDTELRYTARGYRSASDTMLRLEQNHTDRRSLRYTTTVRVPATSLAQATATLGTDAWQSLTASMIVTPQTLTGALNNVTNVSRRPDHNAGGFLQMQLGIRDQLFFTYGLRAEWNPGYGEKAQPNYAPRYGVAYTQALGFLTTKLRGSYGRSTRPPAPTLKDARTIAQLGASYLVPDYGNFNYYLRNPELAPESQQGGEGGLELYFGAQGTLVITRYNQTVDNLISQPVVDSVRSLAPYPTAGSDANLDADGYGYIHQFQYLNIGSIRNQGWEVQGSVHTGPLTTRTTYSWTKSRTIGINPKYRALFTPGDYPQYQPGATFQFLPEHTWALGVTYAHSQTTIGLDITGVGRVTNLQNNFFLQHLSSNIRLTQSRFNVSVPSGYANINRGYAMADLNGSHRLSSRMEALVQIQNVMNHYVNDYWGFYATIGRQLKAGLRIHS